MSKRSYRDGTHQYLISVLWDLGAVQTGGPFKLASGAMSDLYIDCKRLLMDSDGLYAASECLNNLMSWEIEASGLKLHQAHLAADEGMGPLLGAMLMDDRRLNGSKAAWLRRPKDHGTKSALIDMIPEEESCAVIEDVATTGMSAWKVVCALERTHPPVLGVFVLVDRQEGAREFFAEKKIPFHAVLTKEELLAGKPQG